MDHVLNPWSYIYRYYDIIPKGERKICSKKSCNKKCKKIYFWTNIGLIIVELIFRTYLVPQNSKTQLFELRTGFDIIGPTITLWDCDMKDQVKKT